MSHEWKATRWVTRLSSPEFVRTAVLGSLGLTIVLWTLALLFKWHMFGFFQTFLIKRFPGTAVTLGAMVVCPMVAACLGLAHLRRGQGRWLGLFGAVSG